MNYGSLRAIVALNDPFARAYAVELLDRDPVNVVASVGQGDALLHSLRTHQADVVVTETAISGSGVLRSLMLDPARTQLRIVLLARGTDTSIAPTSSANVEIVFRSEASTSLRAAVLRSAQVGSRPRPRLSSREAQVASLVVHGLGNPEICVRTGLSPSTVKTYVSRLYNKLGASTRVGLSNLIRENPEYAGLRAQP